MEDEKKVKYVTMEDLMNHVSVIWSFVFLTLIAIMSDDQVFYLILASVSSLMFVVALVKARRLSRRKRPAMG